MQKIKPRILILSEYFSAGDAITAINLFSKWDRSCLFCSSRVSSCLADNFQESYVLGQNEVKYKFPFSFIIKTEKSGIYSGTNETKCIKRMSKCITFFKHFVLILMKLSGLLPYIYSIKPSTEFRKWIESVNPDFIYTAVNTLQMGRFVKELLCLYPNIKVIYHGYDDWIEPAHNEIFNISRRESKLLLKDIINLSSLRLCTSDKMASDYKIRYGFDFSVIRNPVKVEDIKLSDHRECKVFFAGKIWEHNLDSLLLIAKAIDLLNKKYNGRIKLEIYSDASNYIQNKITNCCSTTSFYSWVPHEEILNNISKSHLLLLPISISNSVLKFTKYSMSTKIAEYLASSVPVFYIGPKSIAMTEFFIKNQCSFIATSRDLCVVYRAMESALFNTNARNDVISRAHIVFHASFDMDMVCNNLMSKIYECYNS